MKINIQILFFISFSFFSYGQYGKDRYDVDSLQLFTEGQFTYEFNINSPIQGLYFDSVVYENLPMITIKIVNNTDDTIIKRYKEKDRHLMWIRSGGSCGRCDTMLPNAYFELRSAWLSYQYGSISSVIDIQYQQNGIWKNCRINTWGSLFPEGYTFEKNDTNNPKLIKASKHDISKDTLKASEYDISKDTVSGLHYWTRAGRKKINSNEVNYYTPRLSSDGYKWVGDKGKKYLDSLNSMVAPYGASIKWAKANGMIISCKPINASRISKIIGNRELHIMLGTWDWLVDHYRVEFKNELTEEEIMKLFEPLDIKPNIKGSKKVIYIQLDNSPIDNNNSLTDQLANIEAIQSITQLTNSIPPTTN